MANGHIEVHDPIANHRDLRGNADGEALPTPDPDSMQGTVELRIMMAYAKRRRGERKQESPREDATVPPREDATAEPKEDATAEPKENATAATNGHAPQAPAQCETNETNNKGKKRKLLKNLQRLFQCVKPQTADEELPPTVVGPHDPLVRCGGGNDEQPEEKDDLVASRLMAIAREIPFIPPDIETDSADDDVEKTIGLLLRESGDKLNDQMIKDIANIREHFWNYSFFRTVMSALLMRMGLWSPNPDSPGPHASPKTQMAVTCEATSCLSAMDTMPTSRLLGHGARYLNEFYSPWVQEQGGYDAAFEGEGEDEDEVQ